MGEFSSELEMYKFFDWLEFYVSPKKNVPPQEAHEKSRFYTLSLSQGRANDTARQLLNLFRQISQTKADHHY